MKSARRRRERSLLPANLHQSREVLGRLVIVQQRQTKEDQNLPGSEVLAEALARQAKDAPYLTQMPGPLELDRLPACRLETLSEEFDEFKGEEPTN